MKEAYLLNKGIVPFPTVTTSFSNNVSNTSVSMDGSVLEDGGADVTARGIARGNVYNPEINKLYVLFF